MTKQLEQLESNKYLVLSQFVSSQLVEVLCDYLWFKQSQSGFNLNEKKSAFELSHEPVLDVVLDYFTIVFSQYLGTRLLPTYGFSRIYYTGAELPPHVDRPACEVSCTFPLGYSDDSDWPIFVSVDKDDRRGYEVNMKLGDMLLYKGQQLCHWRNKLEKDWQAQLFIHYVYADGKNVEHQFDKRNGLLMTLERLHLVEPGQIEQELQTGEIAEQLTSFLQKQLLILKILRVAKKSLLPLVLIVFGIIVLSFFG